MRCVSLAINSLKRVAIFFAVFLSFFLGATAVQAARGPATVEDLKKLEIICFVPTWLPKGFHLKSVAITYDEPGPDEGGGRFPLYQYEYAGPSRSGVETSFTVDCAREGIGDRNLMETEDSEEITITSPFGPMYLIYTPKGKGKTARKTEIKANWAEDAHMKREKAEHPQAHPILGRYHGFSSTGLTLSEFEKIIQSLKPVR